MKKLSRQLIAVRLEQKLFLPLSGSIENHVEGELFYDARQWPSYFVMLLGITRYIVASFTVMYFVPFFVLSFHLA